jgi:hypothetical protein
VCHWTVRCTSGATTLRRNGRLHSAPDSATVRGRNWSRGKRRTGQGTVPVRCGTELSGATRSQCSNGRLRQNPNGWVTWLVHQTVSGGAPDGHRQQPPPMVVLVVEGYKYPPQPPPLQQPKHSTHFIQYKSNRVHSKDTIQVIDPLKVPNSTLAH